MVRVIVCATAQSPRQHERPAAAAARHSFHHPRILDLIPGFIIY
jgi:hypothetical protein